jgi:DNA-binding NarL/FixJ family response regulator
MAAQRTGGTRVTTTLVIADDHEILRDSFLGHAATKAGLKAVASVGDAQAAVNACQRFRPNLLLLDIEMPGRDALASIPDVHAVSPATSVVVLSAYCRDAYIQMAIRNGAAGYLVKCDPPSAIFEALGRVAKGEPAYSKAVMSRISLGIASRPGERSPSTRLSDLAPRELEVLRYIGRGMNNDQMANVMSLSKRTVERHVARLMDSLAIRQRAGLQIFASEQGLTV